LASFTKRIFTTTRRARFVLNRSDDPSSRPMAEPRPIRLPSKRRARAAEDRRDPPARFTALRNS